MDSNLKIAWHTLYGIVTKIAEAMRIHYNYCREHSLLGKTPAEQAGIKLPLEGNKVESLIRLARSSSQDNHT